MLTAVPAVPYAWENISVKGLYIITNLDIFEVVEHSAVIVFARYG